MALGALSTFPTQKDTFIEHKEIQASSAMEIAEWENLQIVLNKTTAQIDRFNSLTTTHRDELFLSPDLNKLQDCIYQMETFIQDNTIGYLQSFQARLMDKGTYNVVTSYSQWNTTQYNGQTFMSKVDNNLGHTPIGGDLDTYWSLLAQRGAKGEIGATGANGIGLVFKNSYNDQVTYHTNECVQYLGNIYACIQDVQGILPTNTTYWSLAVSKGSSTILTTYRNTVTLTGDATNVPIGISAYNQYTDTLLVYAQKLYQEIGQDYKINVNATSIDKLDTTTWTNGTTFYFVVLKNIVTDMTYADGGMMQDKTITLPKLSQDLQDKINNNSFSIIKSNYTIITAGTTEIPIGNSLYNPLTDNLKVYYCNDPLTENINYSVNPDNIHIELMWTLNTEDIGNIFYFEITKKSIYAITQTDGSLLQEESVSKLKLTQGLQDEISGKANQSDLTNLSNTITLHSEDYVAQPAKVTATSSNSEYIITAPTISSYVDCMGFVLKADADSTGAVTANWNGKGAKALKKANGNNVILKNGGIYTFRYNATSGNFILQGEGGEYGTATAGDVLSPKTIGTENGLVLGLLELIGTANIADVANGKTFYNTDAKTILTGTGANVKRFASGNGVVASGGTITVSGLNFTPSLVIAGVGSTFNNFGMKCANIGGFNFAWTSLGTGSGSFYPGGFLLSVGSTNYMYNWIAIE